MKVCYYATNVPNMFIEVSLGYTKGMNYFTYESYNGYKLAFQPMTMKQEGSFASCLYTMFSGLGRKVEAADRFSAKRLKTLAATVHQLSDYEEILKAVAAKHGLTVGEKLTEKETWAKVAAAAAKPLDNTNELEAMFS
jgi:hypothetical protein